MKEFSMRILGKTNLLVTEICWGCGPLGHIPNLGYDISEEKAQDILTAAFKSPITFFDTAHNYGDSEARIGRAIKRIGGVPIGRVIATKADREELTNSFAPRIIDRSVGQSIRRLKFTPLPLVHLHDPEQHPQYYVNRRLAMNDLFGPSGAVAELEKMRDTGLSSYIGISGGPIDMLLDFIETGRFDVVITHSRWNLLSRLANPLLNRAKELGMGVVNAAVYASGILAAGANSGALAFYQKATEDIKWRVRSMEDQCKKYNIPLAAAALQFSLRDPRITSTAVGLSEPEQVEETLRFAAMPIPDELWEKLESFAITEDPEKKRWAKAND